MTTPGGLQKLLRALLSWRKEAAQHTPDVEVTGLLLRCTYSALAIECFESEGQAVAWSRLVTAPLRQLPGALEQQLETLLPKALGPAKPGPICRGQALPKIDPLRLRALVELLSRREDGERLPVELLGALYEHTLIGPTERKRRGAYYTPATLVEQLVSHTLAPYKAPAAPRPRIVDPACGCGAILLGAYRYLSTQQTDATHNEPTAAPPPESAAERRIAIAQRLFGIDTDPDAVRIARLSLCLESALPPDRCLALFTENIRVANSLLITDPTPAFDVVIGNPPYLRLQELRREDPERLALLRRRYRSIANGNFDLYILFIALSTRWINEAGRVGLIVPNKLFTANYASALRKQLQDNGNIECIVDFCDQQNFSGANTYTCLLFLTRAHNQFFSYSAPVAVEASPAGPERLETSKLGSTWTFAASSKNSLLAQMRDAPGATTLDTLAHLFVGVQTNADDVFICRCIETDGALSLVTSKAQPEPFLLESAIARPLAKGARDIRRYAELNAERRLIFPYSPDEGAKLYCPDLMATRFPLTWRYLSAHRKRLTQGSRSALLSDQWHGYLYRKNHRRFGTPKLLLPAIGKRTELTLDAEGHHLFVGSGGGGGGGYGIVPHAEHSLHYLMGVLNSAAMEVALRQSGSPRFKGGYRAYNKRYIGPLPVIPLESAPGPRRRQQVALGELAYECWRAKHADKQELFMRLDQQLDVKVCELYGLTEREAMEARQALSSAPQVAP